MSILASLVFVVAALVIIAAVRLTVLQYRDVARINIAALRECSDVRDFQVQAIMMFARQGADCEVRRIAARIPAPRKIIRSARLRAAA